MNNGFGFGFGFSDSIELDLEYLESSYIDYRFFNLSWIVVSYF